MLLALSIVIDSNTSLVNAFPFKMKRNGTTQHVQLTMIRDG